MALLLLFLYCFIITVHCDQQPSPTLTIQPSGGVLSRKVGDAAVISCKPSPQDEWLPPVQVVWRDSKGRKIEDTDRTGPIWVQHIPNEDGLLLVFSKLSARQVGDYTCQGTFAGSRQVTASIYVKTYEGLTFVDTPEHQYAKLGEDFTVKCKPQNKPNPLVDWFRYDTKQPIRNNDRKYTVVDGGLIIKNVRESDQGIYRCTAHVLDTGETQIRDIKVEVLVKPTIVQIQDIYPHEGMSVVVNCIGNGKPLPLYTWIKQNGGPVSNSDRILVNQHTGELRINNLKFSDNGVYKCIAKSEVGEAEATVNINVSVIPKIYELHNVTTAVKKDTKIICKVQGRPAPRVTFRKLNNQEPFKIGQQKEDTRITLTQDVFELKGETFATLTIRNVNRSDDGLYECIATNAAGRTSEIGQISVEFPPTFDQITDSLVWGWESQPGFLKCSPEAVPNATIKWRRNSVDLADKDEHFKITGEGPRSYLVVNAYDEDQYYGFYECIAKNKHGSASKLIRLYKATPPERIAQVKIVKVDPTRIEFNIEPPHYFDSLPIEYILVQYKPQSEFNWDNAKRVKWSFHALYILDNLTPATTYNFRFAAGNNVGLGPFGINGEATATTTRRS